MSLAERTLKFSFSGAKEGGFSAQGLRATASIQAADSRLGTQAQVKIWGLSLSQMNAYSAVIPASIGGAGLSNFRLVIEAGEIGGQLSKIMDGLIWNSYIDLTASPESCFNITVAPLFSAADPISAQSSRGAKNAETLIASLCAAGGLTFNNTAGAHQPLRNQATYGSVIDQVEKVATAAGFSWKLDGTMLSIWPRGGKVDDVVIDVGPNTGMVGYPAYWEAGIIVTAMFNQQIQVGRQMAVTSSIPKANGVWNINYVTHDLTTMLDGGPWFTTAVLATSQGGI